MRLKGKKRQLTEVKAILHKKASKFPLHLKCHSSWLSKVRKVFITNQKSFAGIKNLNHMSKVRKVSRNVIKTQ